MNDSDSISLRGRGRDTLLPATGLPFDDPPPSRPSVAPPAYLSLSVADAFAAVDWEGTQAHERAELEMQELTVEKFFERFRWDPPR